MSLIAASVSPDDLGQLRDLEHEIICDWIGRNCVAARRYLPGMAVRKDDRRDRAVRGVCFRLHHGSHFGKCIDQLCLGQASTRSGWLLGD